MPPVVGRHVTASTQPEVKATEAGLENLGFLECDARRGEVDERATAREGSDALATVSM